MLWTLVVAEADLSTFEEFCTISLKYSGELIDT